MKARDQRRAQALEAALNTYATQRVPLPGISDPVARTVFVRQLIDSLHRVEYPRLLLGRTHDVPCTCTLQFLNRSDGLELVTYMRSNDVYRGLPHDVFCFTLLQEWIACRLGVDVGTYKHAVGSLHLYDIDAELAQRYLNEGFQSTKHPMPPMPADDPQGSLAALLDAEDALRLAPPDFDRAARLEAALPPYWADLVRLLWAYRHWKDRDPEAILRLQGRMASSIYYPFLLRRAQNVTDRTAG